MVAVGDVPWRGAPVSGPEVTESGWTIDEEQTMANKDRGGKNQKKAATKSLKEKRQAKRSKRGG